MFNSLLDKEIITEIKLMVLRVMNQLNEDHLYTKEMAIDELITVISRLEQEEPQFRPRIYDKSDWK
jgi:hypothetical protein